VATPPVSDSSEPAPLTATNAVRASPADDAAPPVLPNLVRPKEVPGARRVGRNTLEILIFRGLSTPLALGLVVVQARFLDPSGRGAYVLAVLGVTIVSRVLGQLGVAVTNRLADEEADARSLVHRALALGTLLGVAGSVLVVALGTYAGQIGTDVALVAALALVPNVIWHTISGVLLGLARIRLWNYIQLAAPALTMVGMLIFVVWLDGEVVAAVGSWTLANIATAALALVGARDLWLPLRTAPILDPTARLLMRLAFTMGAVHVVALVGYRIVLFVLERYEGLDAVGIYSISIQAAEAIWLIPAAVATAVTAPAVHETESAAVRLVARSAGRGLLITAGAALALAVVGWFAIPPVLGEEFEKSTEALLLLLPGAVAYAPVAVLVVYLSIRRGRPRLSLAVAAAALVFTLGPALVLIPAYGINGAAVSSSIGYVASALLALVFFLRLSRTKDSDSAGDEHRTG
jgi:O-antigen/teichoic acid export membrane protein